MDGFMTSLLFVNDLGTTNQVDVCSSRLLRAGAWSAVALLLVQVCWVRMRRSAWLVC
jgi:hypothetical protein